MISIITAVHNQLEMNKLFVEKLQQYTATPYELIVIDNASTDGSGAFFKSIGATVITNKLNYAYGYSQNQGISMAKGNVFAFLNNDIIVCPNWDKMLLESMAINGLDIITSCGIEQVETPEATILLRRKWNYAKNFISLFSLNKKALKMMHHLMYGNWEKYCDKRAQKFKHKVKEGFVGNSVICSKKAIDIIGAWDETIQAADFDLYIRSKKRNIEVGDIKPCHIALDVFNHHYIRLTAKNARTPFANANLIQKLEDKWTEQERLFYLKNIDR